MSPETPDRFRWFGRFTLAWTGAWCFDVSAAWRHAPYDRAGPAAAALWLVLLVLMPRTRPPARLLLAAAWIGSLLGVMGELHVARHLALVCAVCAWLPGIGLRLVAAAAALSWMPALGWLLAAWSPSTVNAIRLIIPAVALGAVLMRRVRHEPLLA
jgi:hypothetical protein